MYPPWMNEMFRCLPCSGCGSRLASDDIEIVGVRRPEEWEAWLAQPIFVISLICRNCGQVTNALHRQPLGEVVNGVTAFVRDIERDCQGKEPLVKIPGLTTAKPAGSPSSPAPTPPAPTEPPDHVRPSRRRNQPVKPPTPAEIRAFLNRMRKTSFKRGSKGFKNWMKNIGADPDKPVEDSDET
jgi:hypothetical protein